MLSTIIAVFETNIAMIVTNHPNEKNILLACLFLIFQ